MREPDPPLDRRFASGVHATGSVAIMRDPMSLYLAWRNLVHLDRFIEGLIEVKQITPTRSKWTVLGPGNTPCSWESDLIVDEPGQRLSWRTVGDLDLASAGTVHFRELAADRGTLVRVSIEYAPPGGTFGDVIALGFGNDPATYIRAALHRFRQFMETGEVAVAKGSPERRHTLRSDRAVESEARTSDAFVRDVALAKETT